MSEKIHPTTFPPGCIDIHRDLLSGTSGESYLSFLAGWSETLDADADKDDERSRHRLASLVRDTARALRDTLGSLSGASGSDVHGEYYSIGVRVAKLRFDVMLEVAAYLGLSADVTRPITDMLLLSIPHMLHEIVHVPLTVDIAGWQDIS